MVRIAIDGTVFSGRGKGGARYFSNLLTHIAQIDRTSEYHVFVDRQAPYSSLPQQSNFRYRPVHFRTNLYWKLLQFRAILEREPFDLVHFPSESRCFKTPGPSVVTVHEIAQTRRRLDTHVSPYHYLSHLLNERQFRRDIGKAQAIIASSLATKTDLVNLYPVDRERVTVIHLAPDPLFLHDSRRLSPGEVKAQLGATKGFLLSFATGDSRENVDVVLSAFSAVRARVAHNLVLCGAGPATQVQLRQRCHTLGIADRVAVLGFVDDSTLASLYAAADLYIDISYYEGFGLQPCEAMACGVPVIASSIPALMEVLDSAATFVPVDDPQALAAAMSRILENRQEWQERSRLSRERARVFSWHRAAEQTLAIYRSVAGPTKESHASASARTL